MKNIGVSRKFIKLIQSIYNNATAKIKTPTGLTEKIQIKSGVLQGESLSPSLFNIYLNDLPAELEKTQCVGICLGNRKIHCLLFADDVVILATNPTNLQLKLNSLSKYVTSNGMRVNIDKTKVIIFRRGGRLRKRDKFVLNDRPVEVVSEYKYLGVIFQTTGRFARAVSEFKLKGLAATGKTLSILNKFSHISLSSSYKLFVSLVTSTVLYASAVWGYGNEYEVEKVQTCFFKRLYNLPNTTPSC